MLAQFVPSEDLEVGGLGLAPYTSKINCRVFIFTDLLHYQARHNGILLRVRRSYNRVGAVGIGPTTYRFKVGCSRPIELRPQNFLTSDRQRPVLHIFHRLHQPDRLVHVESLTLIAQLQEALKVRRELYTFSDH